MSPEDPKRERLYKCIGSDDQRIACGVRDPSKLNCRPCCPFLKFTLNMEHVNRAKLETMSKKLVNFDVEYSTILNKWSNMQTDLLAEGKEHDAYIIREVLDCLSEESLKIANKRLSLHVSKTELPVFRDYYRKAREDVHRLKAIVASHHKVKKLRKAVEGTIGMVTRLE
jgi:Rad3-related DNA helicase